MLISPPDFTFTFNSTVEMEDRLPLCDWIHIPHVAFLLDPSFHFIPSLKSKRLILACDDQDSVTFVKMLQFPHALFMPHAVERELEPNPKLKRIYDVTMLASFIDFEQRRKEWPKRYSPYVFK